MLRIGAHVPHVWRCRFQRPGEFRSSFTVPRSDFFRNQHGEIHQATDWLVVWLPWILFSHSYWVSNHPNWLSYFSEGFKPPTSKSLMSAISLQARNMTWATWWYLENRPRARTSRHVFSRRMTITWRNMPFAPRFLYQIDVQRLSLHSSTAQNINWRMSFQYWSVHARECRKNEQQNAWIRLISRYILTTVVFFETWDVCSLQKCCLQGHGFRSSPYFKAAGPAS